MSTLGLELSGVFGTKLQTPRDVGMKIAHAANYSTDNFKDYDVFASRVCYSFDKSYWWEEFRHIGSCRAYNSVHAMEVARQKFSDVRLAVMAAAHPLSPSSQRTRASLQTSMAINKMKGVHG